MKRARTMATLTKKPHGLIRRVSRRIARHWVLSVTKPIRRQLRWLRWGWKGITLTARVVALPLRILRWRAA